MAKKIENVIYIVTHPQYPGYVKIGYASDLKQRIASLNTGVLSEFVPYAVYETPLQNADVEIHAIIRLLNPILRASRFDNGKQKDKEFFKLEPEEAFELLKHIAKVSRTEGKLYRVSPSYEPIVQTTAHVNVQPVVEQEKAETSAESPEQVVVPNGTYYLSRKIKRWDNRELKASVKVKDGKWIVQPGSMICPNYDGEYMKGKVGPLRAQHKIVNDILEDEVEFDNPSAAANFCVGGAVGGWDHWCLKDGRPVDIYRKKG